jgi:hypothetical protein
MIEQLPPILRRGHVALVPLRVDRFILTRDDAPIGEYHSPTMAQAAFQTEVLADLEARLATEQQKRRDNSGMGDLYFAAVHHVAYLLRQVSEYRELTRAELHVLKDEQRITEMEFYS